MNKKKLIICSPQLGISPESNLGGEVHDREIINSLCELGVKVIVILPKNKKYLFHKNLIVYYLPFSHIWPPYLFNFIILPWLFWLQKRHKFNILRVHSPYFVGLGALIFKLIHQDIPLIATYHHLEEKKKLFNLIDRFFIKYWTHIITVSNFTKRELLTKYHLDKEKISTVYNGVDLKLKPHKKNKRLIERHKLKNNKILLYFGGLRQRKNTEFLLTLINKINKPEVKLIICGVGDLLKSLVFLAHKLNIDNRVVFTGFISEKEKADFYNLADLFLFPSKKEGFGLSVLEAAACSIPTIASNISSLKEIVLDGRTGYLAKVNDVNDWKTKIEKLLEDDQLRKRMGKSAQEFSQNFSWKKAAGKQIKIYQSSTINH